MSEEHRGKVEVATDVPAPPSVSTVEKTRELLIAEAKAWGSEAAAKAAAIEAICAEDLRVRAR